LEDILDRVNQRKKPKKLKVMKNIDLSKLQEVAKTLKDQKNNT
jgi:hypothetical protein